MKNLTDAEKWKILAESDLNQAASVLSEKGPENAARVAEDLGVSYMVGVIAELNSETAAELLRSLPEDFRQKVILELPADQFKDIKEVLDYPEGTAGAIMSKEYLYIPLSATVKEATEYLQTLSKDKKSKVSYIYVVDRQNRLAGVMQIRDLIFHPPLTSVSEILKEPVVQVETGMSQIDAAKLLQRHRYLGLPVVNADQKLVGVISADNVLQVIEDEVEDDIAKIVGTDVKEIKSRSVLAIMRLRLPWLFVSIASGLLCACILGLFQNNLPEMVVLLLFVPLVLGLSESTGVQGATIVVRNIALGNVSFKDLGSLFISEVAVGMLIGVVCGFIVGGAAFLWKASGRLGIALASSMTLAITISGLIGFFLPVVFRKFKIDPAIASGPLVLAICDIQTLIVYFCVSSSILSR